MAATAKYRDDIAGATVTAGTSTAYTLSTFSIFDTLAHMNGQVVAFTPHATNDVEVMILGGGPSLGEHLEQIRALRASGVKLVTLNGTYTWAVEHGLGTAH